MTDEADWIAAGLLDPDAPGAAQQRQLLAYLDSVGITLDQMLRSARSRGLGAAATDALVHADPELSLAEVAAATGISLDTARRIILASGFALPEDEDAAALSDDDLATLRAFASAMPLLGEESILAFTRVVGSSLARIAEAADAMFLTEIEGPMRAGGQTPTDVARSAREGLQLLLGLPAVMEPMFRRHVAAAIDRSRAARGEGRVDRFLMTVGFADLVSSTQLAASTSPLAVGAALADFEREAADRATAAGMRLVKSIGDEVMVAGSDPVALTDVLVGLAAFVDAHPVLTAVRAAAAQGELQGRGGDWFGAEVNLAARAVKVAAPGQVVVTDPVADALVAAGRTVTPLEACELRGVEGAVTLHLVGRAAGGNR